MKGRHAGCAYGVYYLLIYLSDSVWSNLVWSSLVWFGEGEGEMAGWRHRREERRRGEARDFGIRKGGREERFFLHICLTLRV